jgi:hypothetical protein
MLSAFWSDGLVFSFNKKEGAVHRDMNRPPTNLGGKYHQGTPCAGY